MQFLDDILIFRQCRPNRQMSNRWAVRRKLICASGRHKGYIRQMWMWYTRWKTNFHWTRRENHLKCLPVSLNSHSATVLVAMLRCIVDSVDVGFVPIWECKCFWGFDVSGGICSNSVKNSSLSNQMHPAILWWVLFKDHICARLH